MPRREKKPRGHPETGSVGHTFDLGNLPLVHGHAGEQTTAATVSPEPLWGCGRSTTPSVEITSDTHGSSEIAFGLFLLLGYQFSPR
ncbi:Tn3 family transposase [Streptomyces sp. NBC_00124]|uniref:Tn3 family transposase n=1 Tax=Streptomyces sp. NBC_00124 TaxID=2975662 RepID=UPI00338F6373